MALVRREDRRHLRRGSVYGQTHGTFHSGLHVRVHDPTLPHRKMRERSDATHRYVVLTITTEQGALCETEFGTLPSTLRSMPLVPITRMSASLLSASATSVFA